MWPVSAGVLGSNLHGRLRAERRLQPDRRLAGDALKSVDFTVTVSSRVLPLVMLCSGILCFVFLLFQRDVRELMFSRFGSLTIAGDDATIDSKSPSTTTTPHPPEGCPTDAAMSPQHNLQPLSVDPDARSKADPPSGDDELKYKEDDRHEDSDVEELEPLRQQEVLQTSLSTSSPSPPPDKGVSFLIIIFFYFQDAQLLHIKTVFASSEQHAKVIFREFLAGLFRFQIEIFQFMGRFCFLADLTPVKKMIINVTFVPYILLQFGLVYVLHRWSMSLLFCIN